MKNAIKCLMFFIVLSFLSSCEEPAEINIENVEYEGVLYTSSNDNEGNIYIRITDANTEDKKLQGLPKYGDAISLVLQKVEIPHGVNRIEDLLGKKVIFRVLSDLRLIGYDPIEDHNMWSSDVVIISYM